VLGCALYEQPVIPRPWPLLQRIWWAMSRRLGSGLLPQLEYSEEWPDFLHLTACGDFTMLAREHWIDLRGYSEFDMYPMNIDSLFCWAAHYGGAKEHVLGDPMRIYHIEHEVGSGWTPEGQTKLFERMAQNGVPWLYHTDVIRWACDMNRLGAPIIFNREDWGLEAEELRETLVLESAAAAHRPA
jgi:hypothetical protein